MKAYFVSDVHLGLQVDDPAARESRFVSFLRSLPQDTTALYLLGDVWDFWYEYRDVVPKGYVRVLGALVDLMDRGVEVYFFQGNHDVWTYSYFEELGMKRLEQPALVEMGGHTFCLGHGDGLSLTEDCSAKKWTGWTGSTGVEAKACNCPRQSGFLEYVRAVARLYAEFKPAYVWIDDDLRFDNHAPATTGSRPGCWCERCIADFNAATGGKWTRTSLNAAVAATIVMWQMKN